MPSLISCCFEVTVRGYKPLFIALSYSRNAKNIFIKHRSSWIFRAIALWWLTLAIDIIVVLVHTQLERCHRVKVTYIRGFILLVSLFNHIVNIELLSETLSKFTLETSSESLLPLLEWLDITFHSRWTILSLIVGWWKQGGVCSILLLGGTSNPWHFEVHCIVTLSLQVNFCL